MWMTVDDEFTVTEVEAWLLVALSSVRLWLAGSVWLPIEVVLLVPQLKVSVVWAPAERLLTVCGVHRAPSGASWSVPAKTPTRWFPPLLTGTPTFTAAPGA